MPNLPHVPPARLLDAYNCPHCQAFANQLWSSVFARFDNNSGFATQGEFLLSWCTRCRDLSVWLDTRLLYPDESAAPPPHEDLSEDASRDYLEASSILSRSPRGAAALLRLVVQKLVVQLGETGDLNDAIGNLVKKGLDVRIQQALDVVRVTGNHAVHPGEMDITDDRPRALAMFSLINEIVERMVAQPKRLEALYGDLPEKAKASIEKRDTPKT